MPMAPTHTGKPREFPRLGGVVSGAARRVIFRRRLRAHARQYKAAEL